jgi:hypothetical protein
VTSHGTSTAKVPAATAKYTAVPIAAVDRRIDITRSVRHRSTMTTADGPELERRCGVRIAVDADEPVPAAGPAGTPHPG